ncbi:hypothetical protein [Pseudomonas citronellolis]|uniref:hypothetical protein n=1 Tax=Pseudomonas citronellolis TaxID=53408 RepID=UPI000E2EADE5|nr:hypothetical protein [Pseudomonas citronellolis]
MSSENSCNSFEWTDAFDKHLETLRRDRAPSHEIEAARTVYERLRTARHIVNSFPPSQGTETDSTLLVSVFEELSAEARAQRDIVNF